MAIDNQFPNPDLDNVPSHWRVSEFRPRQYVISSEPDVVEKIVTSAVFFMITRQPLSNQDPQNNSAFINAAISEARDQGVAARQSLNSGGVDDELYFKYYDRPDFANYPATIQASIKVRRIPDTPNLILEAPVPVLNGIEGFPVSIFLNEWEANHERVPMDQAINELFGILQKLGVNVTSLQEQFLEDEMFTFFMRKIGSRKIIEALQIAGKYSDKDGEYILRKDRDLYRLVYNNLEPEQQDLLKNLSMEEGNLHNQAPIVRPLSLSSGTSAWLNLGVTMKGIRCRFNPGIGLLEFDFSQVQQVILEAYLIPRVSPTTTHQGLERLYAMSHTLLEAVGFPDHTLRGKWVRDLLNYTPPQVPRWKKLLEFLMNYRP